MTLLSFVLYFQVRLLVDGFFLIFLFWARKKKERRECGKAESRDVCRNLFYMKKRMEMMRKKKHFKMREAPFFEKCHAAAFLFFWCVKGIGNEGT